MICQYCGKECKNNNSLHNHERLCKMNPNRSKSFFETDYNKTRIPINQFIKAKKEGYTYIVSEDTKEKISKSNFGKKHTLYNKNKIRKTVNEHIENGNWHLSFSKSRTFEYKGIKFQGSWEIKFAKYLDNKNIKWERPCKTYKYIFENENHRYLPDFYLPEYNLYIEIKGYPTKRDFSKWEQFTDNLDIYFGDDLYNLGIIDSYKDRYKSVDKKFRIKHINI